MGRICTVCARGGSKGVKNKNLKLLLGKPLIAHSIIQAKNSGLFNVISVSSDDDDILRTAKEYGADLLIKRPKELATDAAAKIPAIQHCVQESEALLGEKFDTIVDMDATSPLRTVMDIKESVRLFEESDATNLITGMKSRRSPYFNLVEENANGFIALAKQSSKPIFRRQDTPKCFDMNASIYIWNKDSLFNSSTVFLDRTVLYEMPEERSIDIDSEIDFELVQLLANKRGDLL